jgi:molybdenum cofactor cytidylyltransferase
VIPVVDAFNLQQPACIVIVGAGGKTSALFRLAHAYARTRPVLVSNTAHLGVEQGRFANRVIRVEQSGDVPVFENGLPEGVTLITGPADDRGRTLGLAGEILELVHALAVRCHAPLLIEADGSRGLPLKAPADWEPPIPDFADWVIVTAGLSGLGKPLTEENVFRSDIFARLADLTPGALVSPDSVAKVLLHPSGGLKNIPDRAGRIALLNQADTPEQQVAGTIIAEQLLGAYQRVVVASMNGADPAGPVAQVHQVIQPVAGIVLAAGGAERMGKPKQLLDWQGEPMVRRAAKAALEAGLDPVVVVTGAYGPDVRQAVDGLKLRVVNNKQWAEGQSSSLRAGLQALPEQVGAAVFLLADQPFVDAALIHAVLESYRQTLAPVVAPGVKGQRANPVLFDQRTFGDLMELKGDAGGRQIFGKWVVQFVEWEDERILLDVDTMKDYRKLTGTGTG